MTIDIPCDSFQIARESWAEHQNHRLEIINYANQNIAVECIDCATVVFDFNPAEDSNA